DRHPVALLQLQLAQQVGRELAAQGVDVAVGEDLAEAGECRTVAILLDRGLQHRDHRGKLVNVDVRGHAGRVPGKPGTLNAHVLSPSGSWPAAAEPGSAPDHEVSIDWITGPGGWQGGVKDRSWAASAPGSAATSPRGPRCTAAGRCGPSGAAPRSGR